MNGISDRWRRRPNTLKPPAAIHNCGIPQTTVQPAIAATPLVWRYLMTTRWYPLMVVARVNTAAHANTYTHPSELPPTPRANLPSTGNPKTDQKYQQQQQKIARETGPGTAETSGAAG